MAAKIGPPTRVKKTRVAADRGKTSKRGAKVKSRASKSGTEQRSSQSLPPSQSRAEKSPREKTPAKNASFPIVAIGASAGGLEAYRDLFHALPVNTGMAFVLVQHLDPTHHSLLTELIAKATMMRVEEVKPNARIKPDRVYVIPPNCLMALEGGGFKLTPRSQGARQHADLAVNFFMRSLARERKEKAIGVVLSGTGGDGTSGLEDIKAGGGITFAQEPASAKYDGMPRSAIDSGCVDFILPPSEIAQELDAIRRHPYVRPETEAQGDLSLSSEGAFTRVIEQLRRTSGVDFSQYKPNTIHRRTLRRMAIHKLGSLDEYAKHLGENPEEGKKLYDDVLIPVTSFFRDFETFEALKTQVYPAIVKDKANKGAIRMWAPGCSTGEETYSLAMTLLEFLGDRAASFQIQIFGTDLNEKGIAKARTGIYRESIAEEISPERMQRFFVKMDSGYRVNKAVRDMCVFARQNLANDPPFSQMNVVACRNLLIYIQPVLQKKIIPILHYSLKPSGFLVLGSSESVSSFPDLFSVVDKKHKIYAKKATASRLHYDFAQTHYPSLLGQDFPGGALKPQGPPKEELDVQAEADRVLLKDHTPAAVIVNSAMEVVQFRGRTTPYLQQSPGKPSVNLLKLARNGLAVELRTLIATATKKGAPVKQEGVLFDGNGHRRTLNLSVTPLGAKSAPGAKRSLDKRFFLVLFEDVTPPSSPGTAEQRKTKGGTAAQQDKPQAKRLMRELAGTRDALHSAIEAEEALKEEFQSANEEILSANEELQSTNEELETSKEELQSANEELNTLNSELRQKNSDLQDLANDISNLLNSTKIPVVMLDTHLRIRRFTPAADKLFKLASSDIGRPIADIKCNIEALDLEPLVAKVLDRLLPWDGEVKDLAGHWHGLSILPYRTLDNKIDGVVLALQDIDAIKSAGEQLRKSSEFFRGVMDTVRQPLLVLDAQLCVIAANVSFQDAFQVSSGKTVGQFVYDLGNGQWNIPQLRIVLDQILQKHESVTDFEVEHDFESIGHKTMLLNARTLTQAHDGTQRMILLAIDDITERRAAEERERDLNQSLERQARIYDTTLSSMTDFAYTLDREGRFQYGNRALLDFWGVKLEDLVGKNLFELQTQDEFYEGLQQKIQQVFATGQRFRAETPYASPAGIAGYYEYIFNPVFAADGTVELVVGSTHDLTESRHAETALRESEERFRTLFELGPVAVYYCDTSGVIQNFNRHAAELWGRVPGRGNTEERFCGSFKLFHPDGSFMAHDRSPMAEVATGKIGAVRDQEAIFERPDGSRIAVVVNIRPLTNQHGEVIGAINCFYDITERKQAEAALIKSEKLGAAGRLAATLAHEINNPLQAVMNLLSLLGQSPTLDTQDREYARMANDELGRVTRLTQRSLGFYRESISPETVKLEETIESVLELYAKQMEKKKITVRKEYQSDGAAIHSYPGEIRQIFSTLLINAIEAVPVDGRLSLRISQSTDWRKNPRVDGLRITLADNGCGIPHPHKGRIFEPFYTTKGENGTGLGLWVAKGIANRLGGSIQMRSSVHPEKNGTCFSIFLPTQPPPNRT